MAIYGVRGDRMKLHVPPKRTPGWYCGPFALAVLSGFSFEKIRAIINHHKGRRPNTGIRRISNEQLILSARDIGFELKEFRQFSSVSRPTLAAYVQNRSYDERLIPLLVWITRHYVIIHGERFIDNHTKDWVDINKAPWRRKRVIAVYQCRYLVNTSLL